MSAADPTAIAELCEELLGTVFLLILPPIWSFSHLRWVEILAVSQNGLERQMDPQKQPIWFIQFYFLTGNCLSEPYLYQQSQSTVTWKSENWSLVELVQQKYSCSISDLLPAYKTIPGLHRRTDTVCRNWIYYCFCLKWVWYSQYLWEINFCCIICL